MSFLRMFFVGLDGNSACACKVVALVSSGVAVVNTQCPVRARSCCLPASRDVGVFRSVQ